MENKYKYRMIEEYIIEGIKSAKFPQGSQLPFEKELCEQFRCSRMTVNKALNQVAKKNYIERIQGSGSYVKLPTFEKDVTTMASFTEQQRQRGVEVSSTLVYYSVIQAKKLKRPIMNELMITAGDMVHYFVRIRYGNKKPIAVQYTYVPVCRISVIDIQCLNRSFYEYLEKTLKLELGNGKSSLKVEAADEEAARYLKITQKEPVVVVRHVSLLKNGLPFEYVKTVNLWSEYTLNFYNQRGL